MELTDFLMLSSAELVAVKIVDKTKLTPESLQQHNLEVKLLSRLSEHEHPNIVRLYQVINTKNKLYMVMGEFVRMKSLPTGTLDYVRVRCRSSCVSAE